MRANKRETGDRVIKRSGVPTLGGVAIGAIGGSKAGTRGGVNRIGSLLPLGKVAAGVAAIRRSNLQIVIVVEVAGSAGNVGVSVGKKKAGRAVIEDRRVPTDGVMARGAIGSGKGRASGRMRRIVGLLPVGEMAILACAGREVVIVIDVALLAGNVGMPIGEQEARGAVIEFCPEPAIEAMTALAIGRGKRRTSLGVIRIGGVLPIFEVAGIAARGQAESKFPCRRSCGKTRREQQRERQAEGSDSGDL